MIRRRIFADNGNFINGHEFVDLGLPSGTLWATTNVGALIETAYGNYYQYGKGARTYQETVGEADYTGMEDPLSMLVDTARQSWGVLGICLRSHSLMN